MVLLLCILTFIFVVIMTLNYNSYISSLLFLKNIFFNWDQIDFKYGTGIDSGQTTWKQDM